MLKLTYILWATGLQKLLHDVEGCTNDAISAQLNGNSDVPIQKINKVMF
jgi:hypothetical protein